MDDETLKLGTRAGLPEELMFLARQHPRGNWRGQPGLAGTGEFWLANHDYFRGMIQRIAGSLSALRESGETGFDSGPALQRHINGLLGGLDGHHRVEDHHYFPAFQRAEPRLLRGFEILDADHHLIHDSIDKLAATTRDSLQRLGQAEGVMTSDQRFAVDALAAVVDRFAPLLRQHLADEEDLVIPLILERARQDPEFS
ncbi:hemerythrin domain-containing protein [Paracoccus zhejiangensis]|uniref:Cation-binding protein n=1 Tax=Paracoccus zhejiangensis TaxID=1077935 RepID=A0A2H5F2H6_9RHOB|nr:hemerythrin domain-containing protein [Paracoccus zhejiangensis]AUH65743.1 cation-binding protein [Paracoccus zhejiangensis]